MVNEPGGGSRLGGEAKRPTGTPAGVGDATVPSPRVAADRVNTANAQQSWALTVVDEPGGQRRGGARGGGVATLVVQGAAGPAALEAC